MKNVQVVYTGPAGRLIAGKHELVAGQPTSIPVDVFELLQKDPGSNVVAMGKHSAPESPEEVEDAGDGIAAAADSGEEK